MNKLIKSGSKKNSKTSSDKKLAQSPSASNDAKENIPYTSFTTLHNYINYVLEHYENVEEIVFTLIGLITWKASNRITIKVEGFLEYETVFKFQVIRGMMDYYIDYHLVYNKDEKCFEIRKNTPDGKLLAKYTNTTSISKMIVETSSLWKRSEN